jgi:hypothetical protein
MHAKLAMLVLALAACSTPPGLAGKYVKKGGDFFEVEAAQNGEVNVSLSGSYGMNTCQVETGPQKVENFEIHYSQTEDGDTCTIRMAFEGRVARVEQHGGCGCGLNVDLSGTYGKRHKPAKKAGN